tara:strand:+ start:1861 stop:2277 length:417 start_codon:yes stop_codon:yes gene_type:complete
MMSLALKEGYQITKKDSILFVDVENIFTGDIAKQYHQDMMQITEEMKHQPWASLIIYHGNGVFTPDAEEQIVDITKFRVKNNMVANATVFLQSAQADLQQIQLSRIYHGCNLPFYVFSDVKSAKNWLKDFLEKQPKVV